ncbi:hypothetical protein BP6252_05138 [Coleophoma cylindrospora]|uniref:AA1-like domain-containing protein n=1 Tax=Coleophoma cylindrospora TaxID=1849047 RepID=A0A3D8RSW2_9HELO|nr:hypothetical protein BP6252_05138 [Coleophoma cylindrospora]
MKFTTTAIVTTLLTLTTALPTSSNLPTTFNIQAFSLFKPASGNSNPPSISFKYSDLTTNATSSCDFKGNTTANTFYPCTNPAVGFAWDGNQSTLTLQENIPPTTVMFGDLGMALNCYPIEPPVPMGYGTLCQNVGGTLTGQFTRAISRR